MTNINVFIKDNVKQIAHKNLHIVPDIPEKKLNNASSSMMLQDNAGSIIALLDTSLLGNGKNGLAFTGERMVYKPSFSSPESINFDQLESVEYVRDISASNKSKKKVEAFIKITLKNGRVVTVKDINECNLEKLADFLNTIATQFDFFKEENQFITLSDMPEGLKIAYLKVIINMTFFDDGEVDKNELAQIFLLMTRLGLCPASRFTLREYIASLNELENLDTLIKDIDESCPPSHNKLVKISLVKDLYNVFMSVNGSCEDFAFFKDNSHLFNVSDKEVEFIIDALKLDFKMMNDDLCDSALVKGMKELVAKAGSLGVPLAAVYLSGSVTGLSAAGITSGLATLGLGGILGFSSMTTGIGVAVLVGVSAYKGIKHLTGANELDKTKRRELMLNEVIKQTQSTVSYLMEDINFISTKLNDAIVAHSVQDKKVKLLLQKMKLFTSAGNVLTQKSEVAQNKCLKLKCPAELNHEKVLSLTREATKQPMYTMIMSFYEEKTVEREKEGETVSVNVLALKEGIPVRDMEKLAEIFEVIGYYKVADVIKGKLSGIFS